MLWKLRVPAALPYIFAALKVSATACVVGAIIGELPSSIQEGLGGSIINFNQYYSLDPTNLWATNIVAALARDLFFLAVVGRREARRPTAPGARRMSTNAAVVAIEGVTKTFAQGGVDRAPGHRPRDRAAASSSR